MELLKAILYGEDGMLYQIESGNEDMVPESDKEDLLRLAKIANEEYKNNTIKKEKLMIFIDVLEAFSAFQNVEWIRDLTSSIHSALTKDIDFIENK